MIRKGKRQGLVQYQACMHYILSLRIAYLCVQDQLVMDLRTTIKTLREDVRSLASALHQMSAGADVQAVLQQIPDSLIQVRRQAGWWAGIQASTQTRRMHREWGMQETVECHFECCSCEPIFHTTRGNPGLGFSNPPPDTTYNIVLHDAMLP